MTESDRAQAQQRFVLLRPHIEDGVALKRLAEQCGRHPKTLERWLRSYRREGLRGLSRRVRADRGATKRVPPQLRTLIEGLALQEPAPSIAAIHRQIEAVANNRGWAQPSYGSVYQIVKRLDPALVCLAVDGDKAYREQYDLIHRREADGPNEIWQADHTLLDIWLVDESNGPRRPWLTCIIDDYSRALAGYVVGFDAPSALVTSLALRQAIWRKEDHRWHVCGIPARFYTDHGSDFTSRHLEQVAADLKVQLVFSLPGRPRGRGRIERFFETVNQLLLCHLPGYMPSEARDRQPKPSLTLSQFDEIFREFVLATYHPRQHSGTGCSPQQRWDANAFLPQLPASLEQLDLLLLTVAKSRRVRQDGIHFQRMRYIDATLADYVGQDVTIRYDPRDLAVLRIFHRDVFLCRAVCQELAGATVSLRDVIRARNHRRKQLRGELKTRNEVVEQFLAVHQPEQPLATNDSEDEQRPRPRLKLYVNE